MRVPLTWKSRKFILALICAAIAVYAVAVFVQNIKEANATLLLTVVAAPCLLIVGGVAGVQGAHDLKFGEKGMLTAVSDTVKLAPDDEDVDPIKAKRDDGGGQ